MNRRVRTCVCWVSPLAMVLAAGWPLGASGVRCHAQGQAVQLAPVTGRDFAGLRMPGDVQPTDLTLSGSRVWVWSDDDPATPGSSGFGVVQRLLIQGDVRVELTTESGPRRFTAAQASIWIQQLPDAADQATPVPTSPEAAAGGAVRTRQVAIYFDRVSDPGADVGGAGFAQAGDRLLLTGVLRGELVLRHDVVRRGQPLVVTTTTRDDPVRAAASFEREGEQRLARHMRRLLGVEDAEGSADAGGPERPDLVAAGAGADRYGPLRPIRPGLSRVYEPNSPLAMSLADATRQVGAASPVALPPVAKLEPIFSDRGQFAFSAGNDRTLGPRMGEDGRELQPMRLVPGENGADNTLILEGGVVVQYVDSRKSRDFQISAQRAVVFLQPGPVMQLGSFGAEAIKGIYLEGDVVASATDQRSGRYNLRGPRVYYDVQNQQAVMLDAVFWTYDEQRGLPLYVRASEIRQLAANQWQANKARLTTTAFFDPVFSLGASSVTITKRTEPGEGGSRPARGRARGPLDETNFGEGANIAGGVTTGAASGGPGGGGGGGAGRGGGEREIESTYVDAKGITLKAGSVPFFYVPRFKGEVDELPLRDLRIDSSSGSGTALKTAWDAFSVTGLRRPDGLDTTALLDWYFDRGPGLGTKMEYLAPDKSSEGRLFAYTVPTDYGRDVLSSGVKRGRDHEFRGLALGDYSIKLDEKWSAQFEASIISDENFVDAFFREIAREGREVTTSAYLKRQDDNNLLTLLAKGEFNDFTPNHYLLQSQGFQVQKLPEAAYYRLADDLLSQSAPGALVWSHEYRASRIALNLVEPTANELGFDTPELARAAFGFADPNLSPAAALRAAGYNESSVLRADTRQELTGTFEYNVFKISPFLTGRFTAYDEEFDAFNPPSAPGGGEAYRYWYSAGVRTSTQVTRVNNSIDIPLLDIHRTRHIITPSLTVWYAGSNLSQNDLPTYDDYVESIATGSAANFSVAQVWQTQRGGPGRWRSVDVFKLNAGVTGATEDADRESPLLRFFDYRPEYSQLGNFATLDAAWQVTDAVGLTADSIYDLDMHQPARTSAGGVIQHAPDFSSYAEVRYLNALDVTYVDFGCDYKLTRRYTFGFNTIYDTDESEFQSYNFRVRRKVPEAQIGVSVGYSDITDETSLSVIFEPAAAGTDAARAQRLRDIGR